MSETKIDFEQQSLTPEELRDLSAARLAQTKARFYPLELFARVMLAVSLAFLAYVIMVS